MLLPKFVVLKSADNDKYLRYRHEEGSTHEFIQCSGDEEWSPYTKFEVVKATCSKDYIHLKCCYNNKYLTICNADDKWIVARADQPEESQEKGTLFRPLFHPYNPRSVQFLHVKDSFYVCRGYGGDFTNCLHLEYMTTSNSTSVFTYVDWNTIVRPKPENHNTKIGAWGGWEGDDWSFEVEGEGGITKMLIEHKDAVIAVSFVGQAADGSGTIESPRFGGDQVDTPHEIGLDWPNEYLTLIRGTYGTSNCDSPVITWLEFKTNHGKKIGPFGKKKGTAFTLKMERGAIVGFHGSSSDSFIESIGIFTRHVDDKEH